MQWMNDNKTEYYTIHWIVIYRLDRVIHSLNNRGQLPVGFKAQLEYYIGKVKVIGLNHI